jgi:PKD repeat protein
MVNRESLVVLAVLAVMGLSLGGCDFLFGNQPVAIIRATPMVGRPPLTVQFDGTYSSDPDGSITVYKWDFGDGTKATGAKLSHIYGGAGFYAATLTVEDNNGKRGKDTLIIKNFAFTRVTLPAGDGPTAGAVADFNSDGNQDLFAVNQFGDEATILLGRGDGGFQVSSMKLGDGPIYLEPADLDHDGILDLGVANLIASTVSILLGNGDGSFKLFTNQSVGTGPISLAIADLDRDGNLDMAVVDDFCDDVLLLWGKGDGSFSKGNSLKDERLENLKSVAVGDFDGDGNPDLAVVAQDSSNGAIFLGSGQRDFPQRWLFSTGASPTVVRRADVNEDGKDDLIVAQQSGLAILLGWGSGSQTFQPPVTLAMDGSPSALTLLDLDGDGSLDLAVTERERDLVSILLGHGDGTFEPPISFDVGNAPTAVLGLDANNDGRLDLVTTDQEGDTVTLLLNATP